jgi:hypothetical protein
MRPLGAAFNKKLDEELMGIYYRELGGFTESKFRAAVDQHIANGKYWPKIAELKSRLGLEPDSEAKPRAVTFDPDLHRHHAICECLFDKPDHEHEPTKYPVHMIVDAARRAYQSDVDSGVSERKARGYASSSMWHWNIRAFEGERLVGAGNEW